MNQEKIKKGIKEFFYKLFGLAVETSTKIMYEEEAKKVKESSKKGAEDKIKKAKAKRKNKEKSPKQSKSNSNTKSK